MAGARLVGLDLGGTALKAGAIAPDGAVLDERTVVPPFERGPQAVLDALADTARALGVQGELGVGVPGLLDRERGVVLTSPNLPGFVDLDVRGGLARRLGLDPARVHVENDANAAALGEQWLGAARDVQDLLLLTLGTGIGGGLILGGRLIVGAGLGGEAGHVVIEPAGPICGCGARGCVEALASARAASARARAAGLPREAPGDLERLAQRAREGAGDEARLLFEIGRDLGHLLAVVTSLLDLRCYVFGGGFSAALDRLDAGVRAGVDERCYGSRGASLRLLRASLGPSAGWIGAARAALSCAP
jgi:glucokinase